MRLGLFGVPPLPFLTIEVILEWLFWERSSDDHRVLTVRISFIIFKVLVKKLDLGEITSMIYM